LVCVLSPIDVIPEFLPMSGLLDDVVVVVALALLYLRDGCRGRCWTRRGRPSSASSSAAAGRSV